MTRTPPKAVALEPDPARARVVFYDGGCPVCTAEVNQYRRLCEDPDVSWRDVTTEGGPEGITYAQALARFHVRRADGGLVSGFRAFMAVWRTSRYLEPVANALDRPPFTWVGEGLYRAFLLVRPLWRHRTR